MPGLRRQGRILALQLLYQVEVAGDEGEEAVERFWSTADASKRARAFATELYRAAHDNQSAIDGLISLHLENWKLHRLSVTVRNLLRMAVGEMLHTEGTAPAIVMDEAIEMARDFVDEEAARFVNGVLDRIGRLAVTPGAAPLESPPTPG